MDEEFGQIDSGNHQGLASHTAGGEERIQLPSRTMSAPDPSDGNTGINDPIVHACWPPASARGGAAGGAPPEGRARSFSPTRRTRTLPQEGRGRGFERHLPAE